MMAAPHQTPLDKALDRLASAGCSPRQSRSGQWSARCPVGGNHRHGDRNPSLSIAEGTDGKALITCHSGCTLPEVAAALDLRLTDLFPDKPASVAHISGGRRIKATYAYYDRDGMLVFEVVRYQPKDFRQRQPDTSGGWVWNLAGVDRYPLYHAPQVARAIAERKPIWITEGEKDAEALQWEVDGATTCNSGGALSWRPEHTEDLAGAVDVNIVADDDEKGWRHARSVAGQLVTAGLPVRVWAPPQGFKDVAEALGAGRKLEHLRQVWSHDQGLGWLTGEPANGEQVEAAQTEHRNDLLALLIDWPEFWSADHGGEEWVCWPLIPAQRQVALYAPAKTGKSILALAVCAAIATGRPIFGQPAGPPRNVLYLDYEMTAGDLQERLESLGYSAADDLTHLHYALLPTLPPLNTPQGCKAVCELAETVDAEVVVIDTMGRAVEGEENSADSYREFARTTGLALKAAGRAVLRTDHAGKDRERGQRGSSAKNDDVDVVMRVDVVEGGWQLTRTHTRMTWIPDRVTIKKNDNGDGTFTFTVDLSAKTYGPGTKDDADLLRSLGVGATTTRKEARVLLKAARVPMATDRLGQALAWIHHEEPPFGTVRKTPLKVRTVMSTEEQRTEQRTERTVEENTRSEYADRGPDRSGPKSTPTADQGPPLKGDRGRMADHGHPKTPKYKAEDFGL
jgi:hypothetical protein